MDKALSTTKQIKPINKKEFAKLVSDEDFETFVVYMPSLNQTLRIYLNKKA